LPFKLNHDRCRHISRQKHRVINSAAYDAALRQRGSRTGWFTDEAITGWRAAPHTTIAEGDPSFTADGGYDQDRVYAGVAKRYPEAAVVVPPRTTAMPSETAETEPTQRDRHLRNVAKHGRMAWQRASGYTTRARAETAIGRFKQVIGDALRSRTDDRCATEVDIAVHALNRMMELGRPNYVRTA